MIDKTGEEKEQISEKAITKGFPSVQVLITLYTFGAFLGVISSLLGGLNSAQITVSLLISWVLTLGALRLSLISSPDDKSNEEEDEFF